MTETQAPLADSMFTPVPSTPAPVDASEDNLQHHLQGRCQPQPVKRTEVLDVAIVGAGIGGSYSAYKLRDSSKTIGVFEYSDRVGGRLFTMSPSEAPDVHLEVGGMRFVDKAHKKLEEVIGNLGLEKKVFKEGFGRLGRTRFHLRGQTLSYDDVLHGDVPYNLSNEEKANQYRIYAYYFEKLTGCHVDGQLLTEEQLLRFRVPDGRFLYQLSFDEAFDLVASPDGKEFARDIHVFTSDVNGDTSVLCLFDWQFSINENGGEVYTVTEGMNAVPRGLMNKFLDSSYKHFLMSNQHLRAIKSKSDGTYELYFQPTETKENETVILDWKAERVVCARQVILAIPAHALSQVDWPPLREERAVKAYSALKPNPASKVFMMFEKPWWQVNNEDAYVTNAADLIFAEAYDWQKSEITENHILLASYADNDRPRHQRYIRNQGELAKGSLPGGHRVSQQLQKALLKDLAQVYGTHPDNIPEPVQSLSQFWTDYPFGCGWVSQLKGYHLTDLVDTMRHPSLTDDVYVVGSDFAWGHLSAWSEGALRSAEEVINRYFIESDCNKDSAL